MNDPTQCLLELLAREGRSLHALLYRITLDSHAAEDLMQELFLKLTKTPGLSAARNPTAYLRQSAIHVAIDWRRSRRRLPATVSHLPDSPFPSHVHDSLVQQEQWAQLLDLAADLPGLTREVFVLYYLQEEPVADIAATLGKTPHQVRALAHKAIESLRAKMNPASHPQEAHRVPG